MLLNAAFSTVITVVILTCLAPQKCFAQINKYNVTLLEMTTCKEYDIQSAGYKYSEFFHVHSLDNNKIANDQLLHLKFYVMTAMDAHILLSVNRQPKLQDRVYEIVIGAGGNTFSTIRTAMGRRRVATNQDEYLLSVLYPTPIEIVQMKDGNLLVYLTGYKDGPLLNFTDASPLNINYISFSTFGSISARWFYDCSFDGFGSELEEDVRPMTPRQQLMSNLTIWGDNATLPANLTTIDFSVQIRSVSYHSDISILKTRLNLLMTWHDRRLEWDSSDYRGIDTIIDSDIEIWRPTLLVLNGGFKNLGFVNLNHELKIHDNGTVFLIARDVELTTWCLNPNRDWPNEIIECEIVLGLHEFDSVLGTRQLMLNYMKTKPLGQDDDFATYTEWAFKHIVFLAFSDGILSRFTANGTYQPMEGDISIELTISRNSHFYKSVFMMPILTAHSLLIMSFFLRGYRRGALILVVFVVLALGLMFLTRHAAPAYVPSIMSAYQYNMYISVGCYMLHIIVMWLEMFPPKTAPHTWLLKLVNSSPLRLVLCMRFADSSDYVGIQEYPWREIAKILNNLSFIVSLILFVLINVFLLPKA